MLEVKREAMRLQQMQMHAKIQHHQQQLLHQQRLLSASSSKAASAQASDDDDVVVLDGSAVFQVSHGERASSIADRVMSATSNGTEYYDILVYTNLCDA